MKISWNSLAGLAIATLTTAQSIVDDEALQGAVTIDGLLAHAQALEDIAYATEGRNRIVASEGHNNTIKYIVEQLEALGGYYDVVLQPFNTTLQINSSASFIANGVNVSATAFDYSSSVSVVNTAVVPVSDLGCDASAFPEAVSGAVALISRGTCTFADKAFFAKAAGAVAAIIYNNVEGNISGTLGGLNDSLAPAAAITQADGQALVAAAGNGTTLLSTLDIATAYETGFSNNVIATTTYDTNTSDILFLGAHSDSVAAGPGINDDGSGSAGILETAIQLAKGAYTAIPTIKFAWWTAEEEGLLGSTAYVTDFASAEELARIRLYLNFDMIASPNYVLGIYDADASDFPSDEPVPAGSELTEAMFETWFEGEGLNHTGVEFNGRSDYGPFLEAGIPCGGLETGADEIKTEEDVELFGGTAGIILDPNYHTAADNVSNLALDAFEIMGKGIAHAVAFYGANGFGDFPARNTTALTKRLAARGSLGKVVRKEVKPKTYSGHKVVA